MVGHPCRSNDGPGGELCVRGLPPPPERIQEAIRDLVCGLRRVDAQQSVDDIAVCIRQHHGRKVSETSIKRILRIAELSRKRGRPRRRPGGAAKPPAGRDLELGGMKLVEAAAAANGSWPECVWWKF
ncbi:MAG: helix-turn-helix domain-containing protein [Nannocystaceae bacterium]